MLAANRILQPTEPPPDPFDTREAQLLEERYFLRQWMLFIHGRAKERPGAPPGVESAPYLEHFELKRRAIAHALQCGVFEASALILGRLLDEVPRGAHQAPLANPPLVQHQSAKEKHGQVIVNRSGKTPTVTLEDGVAYSVSPGGAAVVNILINNAPRLITYRQMTELDPVLEHQDPSKIGRDIINRLPEPIRVRIERKVGKGCTWI
jgi:hypothetical protein